MQPLDFLHIAARTRVKDLDMIGRRVGPTTDTLRGSDKDLLQPDGFIGGVGMLVFHRAASPLSSTVGSVWTRQLMPISFVH